MNQIKNHSGSEIHLTIKKIFDVGTFIIHFRFYLRKFFQIFKNQNPKFIEVKLVKKVLTSIQNYLASYC